MAIKHATIKIAGQTLAAVADWNVDHTGTATPEIHGNAAHSSVFITAAEVPANETDPIYSAWILGPPNISEFTNDSGFIVGADVPANESDPIYSAWILGPPNISEFTNDSGFITGADVPANETDPVFAAWDKDHADLSNVTTDQHHPQIHDAPSHSDITVTGANIDASFAHVSADGSSHADVVANTLKETNVSTALSLGTLNATTMSITSDGGADDVTLIEADTTNAGLLGSDKWDEIVANSLKNTNVTTDLSAGARTATTIKVDSSDGTDATLVEADTTNAGILGSDKWDEIVANSLKETNVTTNLSMGAIDGTTMVITCSDGTDVTLIAADTDDAGLLTAVKFDEIEANTLKNTNVTTDLSAGARTATTIKVDSSDGTDATLVEADTTNAGILGSDKWDEIVANSVHTAGDGSDHADVADNTAASHARQHAITDALDHTSTATPGQILKADANGLAIDATNTDAAVSAAVTASHTQNTDTALGAGCVADDHGAAATDMVINVCYGTGDPPAANTTTEGSLFVKYTA